MRVEHIMTTDPVACDVSATCADVARLMRSRGVGFVVILQNDKVAGCVTDRQLCIDVVGANLDASKTPVKKVMTTRPSRVTTDDTIFSVVDTMRSAGVVSRLPVVNSENELVGVVSLSDVAVIAEDLIKAVLLDTTHRSMKEARVLTGARRFVKFMRRPTKMDRMPAEGRPRRVTIRGENGLHYGGRPPRRGKQPAPAPLVRRRAIGPARLPSLRDPGTPGRSAPSLGRRGQARKSRSRSATRGQVRANMRTKALAWSDQRAKRLVSKRAR